MEPIINFGLISGGALDVERGKPAVGLKFVIVPGPRSGVVEI